MKCNSRCPFYIRDIHPRTGEVVYGGRGHVSIPGCKLGGKLIIGYKDWTSPLTGYYHQIPIITENCIVPDKRIAIIKDLLGEEK